MPERIEKFAPPNVRGAVFLETLDYVDIDISTLNARIEYWATLRPDLDVTFQCFDGPGWVKIYGLPRGLIEEGIRTIQQKRPRRVQKFFDSITRDSKYRSGYPLSYWVPPVPDQSRCDSRHTGSYEDMLRDRLRRVEAHIDILRREGSRDIGRWQHEAANIRNKLRGPPGY